MGTSTLGCKASITDTLCNLQNPTDVNPFRPLVPRRRPVREPGARVFTDVPQNLVANGFSLLGPTA